MRQEIKEKPNLFNICEGDFIQVYYSLEKKNIDAKVLKKKVNEKTLESLYYVHFLNLEKRMDKWIEQSLISKNYGKLYINIDNSNLINYSILNDNSVLTRKRSNLFSNEAYTDKEEETPKNVIVKNIEKIIIGYYEIETWYYSPFPNEFISNKKLYICEHCLKYMKYKNTLIKHLNNCSFKNPPGKKNL